MRKLLSSKEYGEQADISSVRVRELCRAGRIPEAQKIGTNWVIPEGAQIIRPPYRNRMLQKANVRRQIEDLKRLFERG